MRDEGPDSTEAPSIPDYERANIQISFHGEFHQASPSSLGDVIADIVEVESPIHVQELSHRVTEAAFITRTGSRIRAVIDAALDSAVRSQKVRRKGNFFWAPEMQQPPVRDRSDLPDVSRKIHLIAPEETAAAIERGVAASYGMDRTEIPAAVLRLLLSFRRATEAAQRHVTEVIDSMIAEGRLAEIENHISLRS